jgi:hypothetical protein
MATHVTAGELFERHVMEVYRYFRRMTRRVAASFGARPPGARQSRQFG